MRRRASGSSVVGGQHCPRAGHNRHVCRPPTGCSRQMLIREGRPEETESWLVMRKALWPETDEPQHRREMALMLSGAERFARFLCQASHGELTGFAEASLRVCGEGCESSPVGYLEDWHVAEHSRRQGIGSELTAAAEDWVCSRGCTEMGSSAGPAIDDYGPLRLQTHLQHRISERQFIKSNATEKGPGNHHPARRRHGCAWSLQRRKYGS